MSAALCVAVLTYLCTASTGCDQLQQLTSTSNPGPPVPAVLFPLHRALEDEGGGGHKATVAVLAVVDQSRIAAQSAAAPSEPALEDQPAANDSEALRLERLVRQELNNGFVRNRKLDVVQPDEPLIKQAQDEVLRVNSAALSSELARQLGEKLHVTHIVCAVIEEGGAAVNVACQRTEDGKLVFQDSVKAWSILAAPEDEAAAAGA